LRFAIADTGIGINRKHIGNLFKPFMQADTSINRQFGGTGLGLAICKRLVELMGGTIWVESLGNIGGSPHPDWNITRTDTPPQGSIFHFAIGLPVHASNQSIETSDSLASIDVEIIPEQLPIKILIVEDNILNQKITQLMLKKLGYDSDIIENGQECLTILTNPNPAKAYEIIFMDVQMPVMDGITATKRIRENLSSPHKPWIIALTADALAEEQKACMDAGMNDFISKPVRIKEVSRAIAAYIQQQER
jgi:CheY-like chemotaxis protein